MEEALKILQQMSNLLEQMNYLGRQIDGIDEGVRNRAYTVREIMQQREIEKERDGIKGKFDECQEKLTQAIGTTNNARNIKTMLENKKRNGQAYGYDLDLFITWTNMAEQRIHAKGEVDIDR